MDSIRSGNVTPSVTLGHKTPMHSIYNGRVSPAMTDASGYQRAPSRATRIRHAVFGIEGSGREQFCQLLKLSVLSVIPGVMLIIGDTSNVVNNVTKLDINRDILENIQLSIEIGGLIHNMQIERGTTALYVSSKGDPFIRQRLNLLHDNTDQSIASLSKWIAMDNRIYESRDSFRWELRRFRDEMNPDTMTLSGVLSYYSEHIDEFIAMIGKSISINQGIEYWTDVVAYQMLIISKEEAGRERALGSTYYARGQFPLSDLIWYKEKQVLGASYLGQCVSFSTFAKDLMTSMYSNSSLEHALARMRDTISQNVVSVPSVVSGTIWFDNMTEYINILKEVQDKLAFKIVQATIDDDTILNENVFLSSVELIIAVLLAPAIVFLMASVIRKIQKFSIALKEATANLKEERKKTSQLLYEHLPRPVSQTYFRDRHVPPEAYHAATIMFSNVVNFDDIRSCSTATQVVTIIDQLNLTIDARTPNYDVYKIEASGGGFTIVSGLPKRNGRMHVEEIANLALDVMKAVGYMHIPHLQDDKPRLRIGINTGPCMAGVVGKKVPKYYIFGDTVNTAAKMEATGLPLKIQITEESALRLKRKEGYVIEERERTGAKYLGEEHTYWLVDYNKPSDGLMSRPTSGAQYVVLQ